MSPLCKFSNSKALKHCMTLMLNSAMPTGPSFYLEHTAGDLHAHIDQATRAASDIHLLYQPLIGPAKHEALCQHCRCLERREGHSPSTVCPSSTFFLLWVWPVASTMAFQCPYPLPLPILTSATLAFCNNAMCLRTSYTCEGFEDFLPYLSSKEPSETFTVSPFYK